MRADAPLTDLERESSRALQHGRRAKERLEVEMLDESRGRAALEDTLGSLLARGLLSTTRGTYAGQETLPDGRLSPRSFTRMTGGTPRTQVERQPAYRCDIVCRIDRRVALWLTRVLCST